MRMNPREQTDRRERTSPRAPPNLSLPAAPTIQGRPFPRCLTRPGRSPPRPPSGRSPDHGPTSGNAWNGCPTVTRRRPTTSMASGNRRRRGSSTSSLRRPPARCPPDRFLPCCPAWPRTRMRRPAPARSASRLTSRPRACSRPSPVTPRNNREASIRAAQPPVTGPAGTSGPSCRAAQRGSARVWTNVRSPESRTSATSGRRAQCRRGARSSQRHRARRSQRRAEHTTCGRMARATAGRATPGRATPGSGAVRADQEAGRQAAKDPGPARAGSLRRWRPTAPGHGVRRA